MGKTFAIGDIHGGLKALNQVLEKAAVTKKDTLVFLGDYVDGWSESAQVIDLLIELSAQQSCIFIKGNHDEWCEGWLLTGLADSGWLHNGGYETIESYNDYGGLKKQQHLLFFQQMKYWHLDEKNRLFVHAGFTAAEGPQHETDVSDCAWDRTLWTMALTIHKKIKNDPLQLPKKLRLFYEIYIGHTPTLHHKVTIPMQGCNVWNLDTGAAFNGKLSIMDIDTKQYWQSDTVQQLYPAEAGRNRH
ncbi:MAG: metallophosphoesterase family protein [Ferruginibacter sp.]